MTFLSIKQYIFLANVMVLASISFDFQQNLKNGKIMFFMSFFYQKCYFGYFSFKILLLNKVLINLHLKTEENFTMMAHFYSTYFFRFFRKIFEKAKYFFRFFRKKKSRKKRHPLRKRCKKKRKDVNYKLLLYFSRKYFVVHKQSAVKNSSSTQVCYTPDCLFWFNL